MQDPQHRLIRIYIKRRAIRDKILAIGRLSRVFQVLREESERVTELKTASGGRLPAGTLMLGAEGIKNAIASFEDARKVDLQNERLPPTHDEVRRSIYIYIYMPRASCASLSGEHDPVPRIVDACNANTAYQ